MSVVTEQGALVTVQIKSTNLPEVKPVTADVGLVGVVMTAPFAVPKIVQAPEPGAGLLAANVKLLLPQLAMSAPALAVLGATLFKTTSLVEAAQIPLEIVQPKVTEAPAFKPDIDVVELEGEVIFAPLAAPTKLHKPVPTEGVLAAIVKAPLLHWVWAIPAFEVVGLELLVKTTSLVVEGQLPFVIVQRKVTELPTVKPEMVEDGLLREAIEAPFVAPIIDQLPVPTEGAFAAIVNEPVLHFD